MRPADLPWVGFILIIVGAVFLAGTLAFGIRAAVPECPEGSVSVRKGGGGTICIDEGVVR